MDRSRPQRAGWPVLLAVAGHHWQPTASQVAESVAPVARFPALNTGTSLWLGEILRT